MQRLLLTFCLLIALALSQACAPKVKVEQLQAGLGKAELCNTIEAVEKDENCHDEYWYWLNLGRLYQLDGQFKKSIDAFAKAEEILTAYEERAKVSMRNVGSGAGSLLFSKGAETYYGKGYERTLMHTLNSLNYMLLKDFETAAVEMRKMEQRQNFWLQESESKITEASEKQKSLKDGKAPDMPPNYSMAAMLEDDEVKAMANNYQDAFSYSLSGVVCTLAGDPQFGDVCIKRAVALNDKAGSLFPEIMANAEKSSSASNDANAVKSPAEATDAKAVHSPGEPEGAGKKTASGKSGGSKKKKASKKSDASKEKAVSDESGGAKEVKAAEEVAKTEEAEDKIDVTFVLLGGIGPALTVENIRLPTGYLNYTSIELPAYKASGKDIHSVELAKGEEPVEVKKLFSAEKLAYKTLKDELPIELVKAVTRGVARGVTSEVARRQGGVLAGLLTSVTMDVISNELQASYRNWEMLPNSAYLARTRLTKGQQVALKINGSEELILVPTEATKGDFIVVSQLPDNSLRIDHAAY